MTENDKRIVVVRISILYVTGLMIPTQVLQVARPLYAQFGKYVNFCFGLSSNIQYLLIHFAPLRRSRFAESVSRVGS